MLELNVFVTEFVEVTKYCIEEKKGLHIKDGKYFAVDRATVEELLDHNKFEESAAKFALWKRLHWIDADERQITKSVYINEEAKNMRMIVIDLSVYVELAKFCS